MSALGILGTVLELGEGGSKAKGPFFGGHLPRPYLANQASGSLGHIGMVGEGSITSTMIALPGKHRILGSLGASSSRNCRKLYGKTIEFPAICQAIHFHFQGIPDITSPQTFLLVLCKGVAGNKH